MSSENFSSTLTATEAFVPGKRRGYAILPFTQRAGGRAMMMQEGVL